MDGASELDHHCPVDPGARGVLNMKGSDEERKGPWVLFSGVTG